MIYFDKNFHFISFTVDDIKWLALFGVCFILSLVIYLLVSSKLKKCANIKIRNGLTGADTAHIVLDEYKLDKFSVVMSKGKGKDSYKTDTRSVDLSIATYNNATMGAIAKAGHEAGHAVQHSEKSLLLFINRFVGIFVQIMIGIPLPLAVIGLIFQVNFLIVWAIWLFCILFVLSFVTIPVEMEAGKIALQAVKSKNVLQKNEYKLLKSMLSIASLNYVASTFTSFWLLFRMFLLLFNKFRA